MNDFVTATPWVIVLVLSAGVAPAAPPAEADPVHTAIDEARRLYDSADFAESAARLEHAAQLVRQQRGAVIEARLPEPLEGWTAGESSSSAVSAAMFGGMISAERRYTRTRDGAAITIEIVTDSPMMQAMATMLTNPMFSGGDRAKLETIAGQRAIVTYDAATRGGELQLVSGSSLVSIKGVGVDREAMVAYAAAVKYPSGAPN